MVPTLFWHKFKFEVVETNELIRTVHWLAQKPGSLGGIQRMIADASKRFIIYLFWLPYLLIEVLYLNTIIVSYI